MFNPFKSVGDFFSKHFGNNNEDEERKRREAAARAAAQKDKQQTPNNQGSIVVKSASPTQQPTVPGMTKNKMFGMTGLNSDKPFEINVKPSVTPVNQPQPKPAAPKPVNLNPEVVKAKEKYKTQYQNPNVRDVDNYYGGDRKQLEDEINKGDKADLKKIAGLMTSLDNRKKELTEFSNTDQGKQPERKNFFGIDVQAKDGFNKWKKDTQKKAEEDTKKKNDEEVRKFLDENGDVQLKSGRTINSYVGDFNNMGAAQQNEAMKELQKQAGRKLDLGDADTIAEREEATILLTALEKKAEKKSSIGTSIQNFFGGAAKSTTDSFKTVGDSARVLATDKTALDDVWADYDSGKITKKEAIDRLNTEDQRLEEFTGGYEDRGMLDRALRSAGLAIDVATTVVPVGTAYKGGKLAAEGGEQIVKQGVKQGAKAITKESLTEAAKFMAKETALNAAIGAGGAFRKGTDTTLQDVIDEAAISGVMGGVSAGGGLVAGDLLRRAKATREGGKLITNELAEAGENALIKDAEDAITKGGVKVPEEKQPRWKDTDLDGTPDPIVVDLPEPLPLAEYMTPPTPRTRTPETPTAPQSAVPRSNEAIVQDIAGQQNKLLQNPDVVRAQDGSLVNKATGEVVDEAPAKKFTEEVERQTAEQMAARQDLAAANAEQNVTPETPVEATAANDAPAAQRGGIDTNGLMERIQARRDAFNADQDAAIAAAQNAPVNREASYDPIAPADRSAIAAQLTQLGLDQASVNAIAAEGGNLVRLNSILQNTDWSKVSNPGGYIREVVRRMAKDDKPLIEAAAKVATQADEVVQVVNPVTQEKTFYRIPSENRDAIVNSIDNARDGTAIAGENIDGNVTHITARSPESMAERGFTDGGVYKAPEAPVTPAPAADLPVTPPAPAAVSFDRQALDTLQGQERVLYIQDTTTKLANDIEASLRAAGSTPDDFFGKLAQVRRGEADASILTPAERAVNTKMQAELTKAVEYAEEIANTTIGRQGGEFYAPEYRPGRTDTTSSKQLLDMLDTGEVAGSAYANTRAIPTAELDVSVTPIKEYLNEMYLYGGRNTPAASQEKIATALAREAEADGRVIDGSNLNVAASKIRELTDELKTAARMGKNERLKTTFSNIVSPDKIEKNIYKIDVASRLKEVGQLLGKDQLLVTDKAKGFTLGNKVDNFKIGDSTLGEQGIRDFYDADGLGNAIAATGGNMTAEFEKTLAQFKYLKPEEVKELKRSVLDNINRQTEGLEPDEIPAGLVGSAYSYAIKNAARMNLSELAQRTAFQNPTAQKAFNEAVNPILVKERIQQGYTDAVLNGAATWVNNALRGYNPKSAMTELGDFGEIAHVAGGANVAKTIAEFNVNVPGMIETIEKYGRSNGLDPKAEWARNNVGVVSKIAEAVNNKQPLKILKSIADPMALVKATTVYKESIALKALENVHAARGLTGTDLTRAVLKDYYETVLPSSPLNRSIINDSALKRVTLQYMNWQLMNVRRSTRFATGQSEAGILKNMSGGKGAAHYASTAGATKLALWALQNTLFGTTLVSAFGIFDPTGALQGDFTGIDDPTALDQAMKFGGVSPLTSMAQDYYFGVRREEQRAEAVKKGEYTKGDQENPNFSFDNVNKDFADKTKNFLFPGALQAQRMKKFGEDASDGYATNSEGRITYQTPDVGSLDWFRGMLGGGSATTAAREYADAPDLLKDPSSIIKDQSIDVFAGTRDFNRPLSATTYAPGYSDSAKAALSEAEAKYGRGSPEAKQTLSDWIADGREYNRLYDKFGKTNPEQFKRWTDTYGDDVLTPEKWRTYAGNPEIYNFVKQRRAMEQRDLGRNVDPVFNLPEDQAKAVLQQRSAYTGDDMRLQEFLYKQPWYAQFKADEKAYYATFEGTRDEATKDKSQRVKNWGEYSTQMYEAKNLPEFNKIAEQAAVTEKYGFGSDESNAWFANNAAEYKAQKLKYDGYRYKLVNAMRELEGVTPLTVEEFMAKIEFPELDENGNYTGGNFGSGGGGSYNADKNKINFVKDEATVTQVPGGKSDNKGMTAAKLKTSTNAGSRSAGRKVTIGARSAGRSNNSSI